MENPVRMPDEDLCLLVFLKIAFVFDKKTK